MLSLRRRRLPPLDPPLRPPHDSRRPYRVWVRCICTGSLAKNYADRWEVAAECPCWADAEIAARSLSILRASVVVLPFWMHPVQER